jgi:hypothetical protein
VVEEKKEYTISNQTSFGGDTYCDYNQKQDDYDGRERGPGCEQGTGDFNVMEQDQTGGERVQKQTNIKKDDPGFGQQSFYEGKRPIFVTTKD